MKIDHIGYAVKRIDRAAAAFEKLGFVFEPAVEDPARNVRLAFGQNGGCRIELVCPLDRGKASPVDAYLGSVGPTPYHICYESADLDAEIETLSKNGFKVIRESAPAVAFGGRRVAFLMNLGLGLMEIVEAKGEAGSL